MGLDLSGLIPAAGAGLGFLLGGPAGAFLGADLGGGIAGSIGQQNANNANAQQAVAQMQFQEQMSNTAHQREVADLRAAGLNPMLSANAGASTPSGAMATMQNTMQPIQQGVSNAVEAAQKQIGLQQQAAMNAANISYLSLKGKTEAANAKNAEENWKQNVMQTKLMGAKFNSDMNWAPWKNTIQGTKDISSAVSNAVEAGASVYGVGKLLPRFLPQKQGIPIGQPEIPGIPDSNANTGEIPMFPLGR